MNKDILDLSGIDSTIKPGDNFFGYANGNWVKNTKIPEDQRGWGAFYVLRDQALENMKTILDSCLNEKNPAKGTVAQQVGDLYASALDSNAIDKAGINPIKDKLEQIKAIKTTDELLSYVASEYTKGNNLMFDFRVSPDDKNSNIERALFYQGGIGLPNKNYYFDKDAKSEEIRAGYKEYIVNILDLTNGENAAHTKDAEDIIKLETQLAKVSRTPVELRDPEANYNLLAVADMEKTSVNLQWNTLLQQLKVKEDTLLVGQPEFFKGLSGLLKSVPLSIWQQYLAFHTVNNSAAWLSQPFYQAEFDFFSKKLSGQLQPEPRWKRATMLVNRLLGDALGKLYVQKYFPPEAKEYMTNLVHNLQKAYELKIKEATWMSDTTKEKAIDKLNSMTLKIGYPDKWKDYSGIDISRSSIINNIERINEWLYDYDINKLGKPVDKTEWFMTPPTVNAYYNPSFNEIVFPAGILQPPFYFQNGDDAVNYGGIGFVIGHEMTHGFDDQGSQYDKNGNLRTWWSDTDLKNYGQIADKVVAQYDSYTILDSVHVNGKLTLGENMADIGGLAIAYAAFKMTKEAEENKSIDNLTPDQRFFFSSAQVWRMVTRPETLLWRINNDPHSPEIYRVNGPLSNMPAFYEAFGVKPGDKMYRPEEDRIKIW